MKCEAGRKVIGRCFYFNNPILQIFCLCDLSDFTLMGSTLMTILIHPQWTRIYEPYSSNHPISHISLNHLLGQGCFQYLSHDSWHIPLGMSTICWDKDVVTHCAMTAATYSLVCQPFARKGMLSLIVPWQLPHTLWYVNHLLGRGCCLSLCHDSFLHTLLGMSTIR